MYHIFIEGRSPIFLYMEPLNRHQFIEKTVDIFVYCNLLPASLSWILLIPILSKFADH